jgi:hypothetical protein
VGHVAGFCKHGNEPSNPIKGGEFLDWLSGYLLLKKDRSMETVVSKQDMSVFLFSFKFHGQRPYHVEYTGSRAAGA